MSNEPLMNKPDTYMGQHFEVWAQAIARGETFIGHYRLLPSSPADEDAAAGVARSGVDDSAHPSIDRSWATVNEALTYATEAAHSAIELLVEGHTQGQGNRSIASQRRLAGD